MVGSEKCDMPRSSQVSATGYEWPFVLIDLMYGSLVFGAGAQAHPLALVPEAAPWVITVDGVSKAFAGTGLRVGWVTAVPPLIARMRDFMGHVGAWAPRPEQVATAAFLRDAPAIAKFRETITRGLAQRLEMSKEEAAGFIDVSVKPAAYQVRFNATKP